VFSVVVIRCCVDYVVSVIGVIGNCVISIGVVRVFNWDVSCVYSS